MARRLVRLHHADGQALRSGIAAIQAEMELSPEFPAEVEMAAADAAAHPRLPELDRTEIPFVTVDPESSMDLDQALHIERSGTGFVVSYAIADVAAFVEPDGPVDREANRRGQTLYGADSKVPLHPKVLSEGAASLLPDQVRPALLWTLDVDASGECTDARVERALVRSRAKLSYAGVQAELDAGTADEVFSLLREVGTLRSQAEVARGGVSLPLPEQEIDIRGDDWSLQFRGMLPVEEWNAQISLMTGMAAAGLMVQGEVGLLRTMPPPETRDVERLRRTAQGLGIDWPAGQDYPEFIRSLDPGRPQHAAMVLACTGLLRGAGYVGFSGDLPAQTEHSALAAEYAHVTAPLRRLVDRYALEICVSLCAGVDVPEWVLAKLEPLPKVMQASSRKANQYENAIVDLVEAAVLRKHVGEVFAGVVVAVEPDDPVKGDVVVQEPAIEASLVGGKELPLGSSVSVRLKEADVERRSVVFEMMPEGH
jgi:exoribonuclease R